jgi:hypothetical protein
MVWIFFVIYELKELSVFDIIYYNNVYKIYPVIIF